MASRNFMGNLNARAYYRLFGLVAIAVGTSRFAPRYSFCQEIRLTPKSVVAFADLTRAREVLTNRDEFIRALSPFDRAARMKVEATPTEGEFCAFLATNALAWKAAETNGMAELLRTLAAKLEPLQVPMPARIDLIKSTGREEGGAAYTRQSAIIFPERDAASAEMDMLAHELFHVLSRNNPELRRKLYGVIGFRLINEVELPPDLAPVKLTNPDGVQINWMIVVQDQGRSLPVIPVLFSSEAAYDVRKGGEFFQYLVFRLLVLNENEGRYRPSLVDGKAHLLASEKLTGWREQIGENTSYTIHPDEILADNFVFLVNGRTNLPTPRIILEMRKALTAQAPAD